MSMRWMKLEAQLSVTFIYLLLFSWNKVKINNFLSVIWLFVQYKNTSKIKIHQMPWKLNMIFLEYLRIYGTKNTPGGQPPCHEGGGCTHPSRARPPASWARGGPPPLIPAPTHFIFFPQTRKPAQTRVHARFAAIFDLLAQSTSHKTSWEIVPWYVTPPLVQLVFVLVLYSLQIFAA